MKIKFEFEKATKGALRFKEAAEIPAVGTLYIKKEAAREMGIGEGDTVIAVIDKGVK